MSDDERKSIEREEKVVERLSREHASGAGMLLNPDTKKLQMLFTALARRKVRYGEFYCPCRVVSGIPEKDQPSICPCAPHAEEVRKNGNCLCALFFRA